MKPSTSNVYPQLCQSCALTKMISFWKNFYCTFFGSLWVSAWICFQWYFPTRHAVADPIKFAKLSVQHCAPLYWPCSGSRADPVASMAGFAIYRPKVASGISGSSRKRSLHGWSKLCWYPKGHQEVKKIIRYYSSHQQKPVLEAFPLFVPERDGRRCHVRQLEMVSKLNCNQFSPNFCDITQCETFQLTDKIHYNVQVDQFATANP